MTFASRLAVVLCLAGAGAPGWADVSHPGEPARRSITDTQVDWPTAAELLRVITLQDYNTRVVVLGVAFLGLAAGATGSFLLLRKRALLGDALSHATLPGIALSFMAWSALGGGGKPLPVLLLGAALSGVVGVACILLIVHLSRIREDAALGIVLSVFFGLGAALLSLIQSMRTGSAAGLQAFIYGKTASMLYSDAVLLGVAAVGVALVCGLLFKELGLLCFDAGYARAQGWPVVTLDIVLMALVVVVTVVGLQAVGLILMIALLVIPPAAARFWTHHLPTMVLVAAAIGAVSGLCGAALSALTPRLPAGAVIVLVAGVVFAFSMTFGPAGGALPRALGHLRLTRKIQRQHLLRTLYELGESRQSGPAGAGATAPILLSQIAAARTWSRPELNRITRRAARTGLLEVAGGGQAVALTPAGEREAWRTARNHRLWELYLITHADIAPSHVDRDADEVEHVLDPPLIAALERQLAVENPDLLMPASPHALHRDGAP
jgi:manganese/zinc/iron transport system permease protein